MAALDFPDNPTNGQVFDKWTWNGTMWVLTASGSGGGGSGFTFNQDATPTATKVGDTWYETDTGDSFVWTNDGNSTQWVQFAPGSGGGGGSGFTYVTDTKPTPSKVGDTWFDTSTLASGGTSWLAIEESPGGEKVWVQFAPGSGLAVTPGMMLIADSQLTGVTVFDFVGIPQTYKSLRLTVTARAAQAAVLSSMMLRFNNAGGAEYDYQFMQASGTGVGASEGIAQSWAVSAILVGSSGGATLAGAATIDIPHYADGYFQKTFTSVSTARYSSTSGTMWVRTTAGHWRSVQPINRIQLFGEDGGGFAVGSHASLYGLT